MSDSKPERTESQLLFVYLDGDGVGDLLELALLNNEPAEAAVYSHKITSCMQKIETSLHSREGASVVFVGGDEILATLPAVAIEEGFARNLQLLYLSSTGTTASIGIGHSSSEAAMNLRRAKLQGKNSIVGPSEGYGSESGEVLNGG